MNYALPYRSKYPALKTVVEYLNLVPAFRNTHYKTGWTFKWVMVDEKFEEVKGLIEEEHPECAVKLCSLNGILLWIPKPGAGTEERRLWLTKAVGPLEPQTYHEGQSQAYAARTQGRW